MARYSWIKGNVPSDLVVKQVYGIAFYHDGHILLRVEDNKYKLTGGKPEKYDKDFEETLKREYIEELNVELEDIYYLGYLLVEEENNEKYAQVRMIAKIKNFGKSKPDIDNGKTYQRFMANIKNTKKYLNYPDLAGNQLIDDAINMAKEKYKINFNINNNDNEYFI